MKRTIPLSPDQLKELTRSYPTPFYLYDERGIRNTVRELLAAFDWNDGFREFFAVKALPNLRILQLLHKLSLGADCSSLPELLLAERAGITGEQIMFTSNDTPADEFQAARRLGAIINLDDIGHLPFLEKHAGLPPIISFRYNPGTLKTGNAIIGNPIESKFGVTRAQLFDGYRAARKAGIRRFGIHTMVASNELNADYFVETAQLLFKTVVKLSQALDISFEFANIGGGIGIPYRPEELPVDLAAVSTGIRRAYDEIIAANGLHPLKLFMENGRLITGPHGYLVARVRHIKRTHKTFIGLDANMSNFMRPALYGAYHIITIPGKDGATERETVDVVGSLCENNDKFAIDRDLPRLSPGDLVVIHDAGAHGHAMGFNYNGKLRSSELLLRTDGSIQLIRRAETIDDYFATLV